MALRYITGRSGQGKTEYLVKEVIRRSIEISEKQYYVIVPEQFSLEMQRKIVKMHPRHGFFNIDVLSFHRLSYRIFAECNYQPKEILEDLGVSMMLRKILSEEEGDFLYFKKSMKKPGFIDELKSMLMEFIGYGVSWKQVEEVTKQLGENKSLCNKCEELGRIYERFEKAIEGRFMVTEQILDIAREFTEKAPMLKNAVFYFDGFAGFTPVQIAFLRELLKVADQINVTVTIPEFIPGQKGMSEDLFNASKKTADALLMLCKENMQEVEEIVNLREKIAPRFINNPEAAFLEQHLFQNNRESYDDFPERMHMTVCRNPDGEADYVMHKIEQLVRQKGYRYRDFAVLSGDVAEYASAFKRKAAILNISVFEDTKKKVSYHSGVEAVRSLFHLAQMDYSYESVFRYLKSGMSDLMDEEADYLENYVLYAGIRGLSMWKKPFVRRLKNKEEDMIKELHTLQERFMKETEHFCQVMRDKEVSVKDKMKALYLTMTELAFEEKFSYCAQKAEDAGDYVKATEYRQLYELLISLIDKIVMIFGEEKMTIKELGEIMDAGLDSLGLGVVPLSMDQVVLGDLKRSRLHEIKVLFITGMNDGKIPPNLEDRGIISDDEKELLKQYGITLSQNLLEQSMEDEFYMYMAFSKPTEELYFSYSLTDSDGTALRPSVLQKNLSCLFPKLNRKKYPEEEKRYYFNEEDSREFLLQGLLQMKHHPEQIKKNKAFLMLANYWNQYSEKKKDLEKYGQYLEEAYEEPKLSEDLMEELYGKEISGSVTRLERFAACPYQYYCIYGLELKEREEYKIRPMDLGNLFHKALETFSKKVKESDYSWKTIPEKVQNEYISEALQTAMDENLGDVFYSSSRNQYKIKTVERIMRRTIGVLRAHLKNSEFEPDRFELHFGKQERLREAEVPLSNGRKMFLLGTIDRVDVCEEDDRVLMRVIDYKSGAKKFEMEDFYYGLELQLIIYMNAAEEIYHKETEKDVTPAGVFYYQLQDPIVKADYAEEESLLKNFRMSGMANSDGAILNKLEAPDGDFLSMPVRLKKSGEPYKNSPVMGTQDFHYMGGYAKRKAAELGGRIYKGEIRPRPYRNKKGTACDYCPFADVCGFDVKLPGYEYQSFQSLSVEEVLEKIREEGE